MYLKNKFVCTVTLTQSDEPKFMRVRAFYYCRIYTVYCIYVGPVLFA